MLLFPNICIVYHNNHNNTNILCYCAYCDKQETKLIFYFIFFFTGQNQTGQGTLIQGQALQGQPVFIQGQPSVNSQQVVQNQTIMLQGNQVSQGQVQLITTSTSSTGGQQLQIVPHIQQKQGNSLLISLSLINER